MQNRFEPVQGQIRSGRWGHTVDSFNDRDWGHVWARVCDRIRDRVRSPVWFGIRNRVKEKAEADAKANQR